MKVEISLDELAGHLAANEKRMQTRDVFWRVSDLLRDAIDADQILRQACSAFWREEGAAMPVHEACHCAQYDRIIRVRGVIQRRFATEIIQEVEL
jgi:hypothetical protein